MNYALTPEQNALLRLSQKIWLKRGNAKRYGLPFGEETITETILMDLVTRYPGRISILPFNKRQESKNGADWAWAFTSLNRRRVTPMLVQAKVLDAFDKNYPEIKRAIGTKPGPKVHQIDRLIATAKHYRWPAIYAFYNHLSVPSRIPAACGSLRKLGSNLPDAWGISIALASSVRSVLPDQSFDTHRTHSVPLHCLLCSGGSGLRPASGAAGLALAKLASLRRMASLDSLGLQDSLWFDEPLDYMPDLFVRAENILESEAGEPNEYMIGQLAEQYPGIAGVAVFTDGPSSLENTKFSD